MSFTFSPMFPLAKDNTEYELIEKDYVSSDNFLNKSFLLIQPEALRIITEDALYKISHFYRSSHLKLILMRKKNYQEVYIIVIRTIT